MARPPDITQSIAHRITNAAGALPSHIISPTPHPRATTLPTIDASVSTGRQTATHMGMATRYWKYCPVVPPAIAVSNVRRTTDTPAALARMTRTPRALAWGMASPNARVEAPHAHRRPSAISRCSEMLK